MRASGLILLAALFAPSSVFACPVCDSARSEEVRAGIAAFSTDPFVLVSLLVPALFVGIFAFVISRRDASYAPLGAGFLLGVGMGGFFDGIVLHQMLQTHNMLSNRLLPDSLVNMEINMFYDGLFHVLTWVATGLAFVFFWRAAKARVELSGRALLGAAALGWGVFNFGEGLLNHQLLEVHHVVQFAVGDARILWDLAFLASGVLLMGIGYWLRRPEGVAARPVKWAMN